MKKTMTGVFVALMVLVTATACGSNTAATVDGEKISENDVTARIEAMRTQNPGFETEEGWKSALKQASLTPETLREKVIEGMIRSILVSKAAEKEGLKPDDNAIDEQIQSLKSGVGDEKGAWKRQLASYGASSEKGLKQILTDRSLSSLLLEKISAGVSPTDKEIEEYIVENAADFAGRNSSQILISAEDGTEDEQMKLAKLILAKLKKGEDFATLAKKYSRDALTAGEGGEVGWSYLTKTGLPQEYTDALAKLKENELSAPVKSNLGVHIIKCTGVFEPKQAVKPADVPEPIAEALEEQATQAARQTAYDEYVNGLYESAKIKINKMPKKISYGI